MGIADFFLGKKQQDQPSLNDLIRVQNRSIPERISLPGFQIRGGANDGRPFFDISEDPNIRGARESQQGFAAQLSGQLGGFGFGDPIQADAERAGEVEQATFDRALNLLQPGIDRNRRRVEQGLSNRGLPEGGEARGTALQDLSRDEQAQLENLALSAVLAGENAQTADVNRQLSSRQQFLQQISQLLFPQTGAPTGVQGPQLSGGDILAPSAQSGAALSARNQQQSGLLGAILQAAGQVGGAAAAG